MSCAYMFHISVTLIINVSCYCTVLQLLYTCTTVLPCYVHALEHVASMCTCIVTLLHIMAISTFMFSDVFTCCKMWHNVAHCHSTHNHCCHHDELHWNVFCCVVHALADVVQCWIFIHMSCTTLLCCTCVAQC